MADTYNRRLSPFNIINEPSPYIVQSPPPDSRSPPGYKGSPAPSGGSRGGMDTEDSDDDHTPSSPLQLSREDVLSALGYKSDRLPQPGTEQASKPVPPKQISGRGFTPTKSEMCNRCGTKVYPVEKIDVGEVYHRGCFKCQVCGIQLTLKTFHRVEIMVEAVEENREEEGVERETKRVSRKTNEKSGKRRYIKDVYCKTHVPKHGQAHFDQRAMEIRTAIDAQKKASGKTMKPYETSPYRYEGGALEFQHAREIKQRQKVKRKSSLKTNKDYEKFGVYDEQAELEKRHRREEDELYKQIFEERREQMEKLEEFLVKEKERTVRELIDWFEEKGATSREKEEALRKVDRYFATQREERVKRLLRRMAADEQAAVTRMIEKHAQEMLFMIEEKDREAGEFLGSQPEGSRRRDERGEERSRPRGDPSLENLEEEMSSNEGDEEDDDDDDDDDAPTVIEMGKDRENDLSKTERNEKSEHGQKFDIKNYKLDRKGQDDIGIDDNKHDDDDDDNDNDDVNVDNNNIQQEEEWTLQKPENDDDMMIEDDLVAAVNPQDEHGENYRKKRTTRPGFESSDWSEDDFIDEDVKKSGRDEDQRGNNNNVINNEEASPPNQKTKIKSKAGYKRWKDSDDDDEEMKGSGNTSGNVSMVKEMTPNVDVDRLEVVSSGEDMKRKKGSSKRSTATVETQTPPRKDRPHKSTKSSSRYQDGDLSDDDESDIYGRKYNDDDDDDDDDDDRSEISSRRRRGKHNKSSETNLYDDESRSSKSRSGRPSKAKSSDQSRYEDSEYQTSRKSKDKNRASEGEERNKKDSSKASTHVIDVSGAKKKKMTANVPGAGFQLIISTERIPVTDVNQLTGAQSRPMGDENESSEAESVAVSAKPDVTPPKYRKSSIYRNPDVFREFDRQAIEEAKRDPSSFTDLVRTLCRNCKTDVQKVRAIFRWITAKDLNKIQFSEKQESNTPMGLLRGIKYGTETYHGLFKRLCSYAGLHCEVIEGYSKGVGYRPGSEVAGRQQFRNQWTAVWVDDSWRFVNCNWGARHVKRPKDSKPTYKVDEFYFLTDPEEHIYQHFPDDKKWQLLPQPLTVEQFVRLPVVKSPFFNAHLSFDPSNHAHSIISTNNGRAELRICSKSSKLGFAAKLRSKDGSYTDDVLANRTLVRLNRENEKSRHGLITVVFLVNLPGPGKFYWDIFMDSDWSSESMDNACSVMIRCKAVGSGSSPQVIFPQMGCFGVTPRAAGYGVDEDPPRDSLISAVVGELHVIFKSQRDDVRLSHSLRYWAAASSDSRQGGTYGFIDCDRFAMCTSRIQSSAVYSIRCPRPGFYVFSLGGATREDGASHHSLVTYFVECRAPVQNPRSFPRTCSRWSLCRLLEPMEGDLACRAHVRFRIESSKAREIVVCVNGADWTSLQHVGGTSGSAAASPRSGRKSEPNQDLWAGSVFTGEVPNVKLNVYAKFSSKKDKYIPLLEYAVKEASLTDEVRNLFKYL